MDLAKNAPHLFSRERRRSTLVWFSSTPSREGTLAVGNLLITFVLLGSFLGAALMIRYLNTRSARPAPIALQRRMSASSVARQHRSTRL
jgi:hypothetical protein